MGVKSQVAMMLVAFAVFKFFTAPPPDVTGELKTWMDSGKYFEFNDFQIFYIDRPGSGSGGTLVALHGFPTSSFDWVKILPELRRHFSRVILLDFIGFGFSDKPTQHNYSISEQADITENLVRSLGDTNVHLISHDYGDTVALELIARQNERRKDSLKVTSLCMLNGGIFTETNNPRLLQRLLLREWLGPVLSAFTSYPLFRHGMSEVFGKQTQPTDTDFYQFWTTFRYNYGDRVGYRILQYIPERTANKERWEGALRKTSVPVHMIYGPADPVNPSQFAEHYRKTVPSPSITVLPDDIGHYPQWETPDAVLRAYLQFLRSLQT